MKCDGTSEVFLYLSKFGPFAMQCSNEIYAKPLQVSCRNHVKSLVGGFCIEREPDNRDAPGAYKPKQASNFSGDVYLCGDADEEQPEQTRVCKNCYKLKKTSCVLGTGEI